MIVELVRYTRDGRPCWHIPDPKQAAVFRLMCRLASDQARDLGADWSTWLRQGQLAVGNHADHVREGDVVLARYEAHTGRLAH